MVMRLARKMWLWNINNYVGYRKVKPINFLRLLGLFFQGKLKEIKDIWFTKLSWNIHLSGNFLHIAKRTTMGNYPRKAGWRWMPPVTSTASQAGILTFPNQASWLKLVLRMADPISRLYEISTLREKIYWMCTKCSDSNAQRYLSTPMARLKGVNYLPKILRLSNSREGIWPELQTKICNKANLVSVSSRSSSTSKFQA